VLTLSPSEGGGGRRAGSLRAMDPSALREHGAREVHEEYLRQELKMRPVAVCHVRATQEAVALQCRTVGKRVKLSALHRGASTVRQAWARAGSRVAMDATPRPRVVDDTWASGAYPSLELRAPGL